MSEDSRPELKAAITKAGVIDAILIGAGAVLYFTTGEIAWFVGFFVAGSTIFLLLLAQAGAFTRPNDRA